tara:strand:- start:3559 stop:3876 length:318 start_codon:yes stop_codon:yes gene_type:complete
MGKKTITTFIYNGVLDYYLRVPLTQPPGKKAEYSPQYFITEYYPKDSFTLRQVIERRLEIVKDAEAKGLRKKKGITRQGFSFRIKDSAFFEKEEREGLYEKYNNM